MILRYLCWATWKATGLLGCLFLLVSLLDAYQVVRCGDRTLLLMGLGVLVGMATTAGLVTRTGQPPEWPRRRT